MFRQRSLLLAAVLAVPGVILANEFIPTVPEQCQQMGFCENLPDYPAERVADIIKQLGSELDKYKVQVDASTLLSRNGDEEELCDFKRKTIVPMAAPDTNGQWHYVVNQKEAPLQSFIVEVCTEAGSPCSDVAYIHTGYTASCKQKFIYRNSPSLSGGGEMVERQLMFPSSCSCQVRQADDL